MAGSLVIEDRLNLRGLVSVPRLTIGTEHDWYAGVAERLDSFARVLVPADVVNDVRDAVLVQLPFNGFTGHAAGLSKQFGDGLVGVHGFFRVQEAPAVQNVERGGLVEHKKWPAT